MSRKNDSWVFMATLATAFATAVAGGALNLYKNLHTQSPPAASKVETGCAIKAAEHQRRIDDALAAGYNGYVTPAEDVRAECIKGSPGYDAGGGRHPG